MPIASRLGSSESVFVQIFLHAWILSLIMQKRRGFANAAVTSTKRTHSLHIDSAAQPVIKHTRTEALTNSNTASINTVEPFAQDSAAQSQPTVLSSVSLQECSDWLQALPEDAIAQSSPLKRVHSATALLQMPSTRDQRDRIQDILEDWHVPQKHKGHKRVFGKVKAELVSRVVEESRRLKTMHNVCATVIPAASPLPSWATYSAIQASLRNQNSSNAACPQQSP